MLYWNFNFIILSFVSVLCALLMKVINYIHIDGLIILSWTVSSVAHEHGDDHVMEYLNEHHSNQVESEKT